MSPPNTLIHLRYKPSMGSKEEIIRLLWTLLGALLGAAVGFVAMTAVLNWLKPEPLVSTFIVLGLCGGGLVGGGYATLTIISKRQRAVRKKYFEEKKKQKKRKK
jgi:hypothetical protein